MSIDIQEHYDSVETFNKVAGNLDSVDVTSIRAQMDFIAEEGIETYDAIDIGDNVELLDGACDLFVTVVGLLQKLEVAGYNVDKALYRVCQNNLSKFPFMRGAAALCPDGADVVATKFDRVVFKRVSDGKVLKPKNFVPVDLTDLVPMKGRTV